MSKLFVIGVFIIYTHNCFAQKPTKMLEFKDITPAGYAQYVEVDLGKARMLLISGQVPLDEQGNTVGVGDLTKQIDQTFLNLKSIIEKAGGTMNDIAKLNYYLVDLSQIQLLREVRNKYINVQNPPASTAVEVGRLFREDVLIEIEATVIIPK